MEDLLGRLSALDPDAGAAVHVIAYFDRLVEARAGLEAIVRGAAVLAGCPAGLSDPGRGVHVRVLPDGRRADAGPPPDPAWPRTALPGGQAVLWLERPPPAGPVGAMALERAAAAARGVLDRTRGRAPLRPPREDPALVELVLDACAPAAARARAARELGLPGGVPVRAVALEGGAARVGPAGDAVPEGVRAGVGPAVDAADLPRSWALARTALRLAAEGTPQDPGPRVVHADELGGLAVLAAAVGPGTAPAPDVRALERAGAGAPWTLTTLYAVAYEPSLRAAAARLTVHHSTLQDRLAHAEHLLGWTVRDPRGRLRLQLALALRRLHREDFPS
ncbi:helix-turn-helix domain-containing protein [Planomonospora corallina]|uniref:Helix-turn-helix domain-containing protein n=1 Tax=Planomonospora corallina TaxID=1806052 RepID=A0ABV8I0L2_9ACTN